MLPCTRVAVVSRRVYDCAGVLCWIWVARALHCQVAEALVGLFKGANTGKMVVKL